MYIRVPYHSAILSHCKGTDFAHTAKITRNYANAMRLHLPSINSVFFYRDFHPPWQLYANSPSALLYYHLEQMFQPLQNLEVTKTINLIWAPG